MQNTSMDGRKRMTQISPTEFGRMQADVDHIKGDVSEIKELVRNQDYVSRREYQKALELLESHDEQLEVIKTILKVNDATFSGQLNKFLNKGVVVAFGGALTLVVVYMMYLMNSNQINQLKADLHLTNEHVRNSRIKE